MVTKIHNSGINFFHYSISLVAFLVFVSFRKELSWCYSFINLLSHFSVHSLIYSVNKYHSAHTAMYYL